jgi:uncharacterized phage protein (TIGR01671 family)
MREIKFRIWDKQTKNWLENSSSLHCFSSWTICPFTGNLVDYVGDYSCDSFTSSPAVDYYWQGTTIIKEPRYVIQQYTGLKDSKGIEIYEGDIVKTVDGISKISVDFAEYTSGEVQWLREGFEVCQKNIGATRISVFSNCDCCPADLEIISNIFETPELLK